MTPPDRIERAMVALLTEMFKRVGLDYDQERHKGFTKQNGWWIQYHWTDAEEDDFKAWAISYLRKNLRWNKPMAEREMAMFLLSYGWTTIDTSSISREQAHEFEELPTITEQEPAK